MFLYCLDREGYIFTFCFYSVVTTTGAWFIYGCICLFILSILAWIFFASHLGHSSSWFAPWTFEVKTVPHRFTKNRPNTSKNRWILVNAVQKPANTSWLPQTECHQFHENRLVFVKTDRFCEPWPHPYRQSWNKAVY